MTAPIEGIVSDIWGFGVIGIGGILDTRRIARDVAGARRLCVPRYRCGTQVSLRFYRLIALSVWRRMHEDVLYMHVKLALTIAGQHHSAMFPERRNRVPFLTAAAFITYSKLFYLENFEYESHVYVIGFSIPKLP